MIEKMPPADIELEKMVLGAILQESDVLDDNMSILHEGIFYQQSHKYVFRAIENLYKKGKVDIVTVTMWLKKEGLLEQAGGAFYITEITGSISATSNTGFHIHALTEMFLKRLQIKIYSEAHERAFSGSDVFEDISIVEKELTKLNSYVIGNSYESDTVKKITARYEYNIKPRETWMTGVPSNFDKINSITRGFQKEDLILLAARPSMGKTAFSISLAIHALRSGYKVCFFSLEMGENPIYDRMLQNVSELDWDTIAYQRWSQDELKRYSDAKDILANNNFYLNENPANVNYLKTIIRERQKKYGVDIVFVDYLQLMPPVKHAKSREEEVSEIGKSLKLIAKELQVPIIAISSLNRASESRTNKRPVLGDLREGGALEFHADLVISLYRPSYYWELEYDKDYKRAISEDEYARIIEINIMKHRNGAIGKTEGYFYAEKSLFKQTL